MNILERLYASSGSEVIIQTMEINIGGTKYWLAQSYEDVTATIEDGSTQLFEACALDIALPARNSDGTQDLKFAMSNITGLVSRTIRDALKDLSGATLTHRSFISTDLTGPAEAPFSMTIKSGYWTNTEVQITAGFMNVLDTRWPRFTYTLNRFPGLRYT